MSVAIVIGYRAGHEGPDYLPIATERVFREQWLPLTLGADFEWLPAFASGTSVDFDSLPEVVDEFRRLADLAAQANELSIASQVHITDRARRARRLLGSLDRDAVEELFIG
jgi:hypothetical protein